MKQPIATSQCELQEGSWDDFRLEVQQVEPKLFQLIENISPGKNYRLIKLSYPFGAKITDLGTICLPGKNGELLRLDDPQTNPHWQDQLGYSPTPMILQLSNASEVFVEASGRIIPLNVFKPGDLYGLFEVMVPLTGCPFTPCWSVTSGARSVFMGAKITDRISHKRLFAEYGLPSEPPASLTEQWDYFKIISNRSKMGSEWRSKVLLFTREWFKPQDHDINWLNFHYYISKKSWIQSRNTRIKDEFSIMWEAFNSEIGARRLKPNPYIVNTVMHTIYLANGTIAGFKPVMGEDELLMPSLSIENAYQNLYQLREYAPIIMAPSILDLTKSTDSLFYSMSYPTLLEGTPAIRQKTRIINELREVQRLILMLHKTIDQQKNPLFQFIKNSDFDYFHTQPDNLGEIADSEIIREKDQLVKNAMQRFSGKTFPYQGPFFHGFVRITRKNLSN